MALRISVSSHSNMVSPSVNCDPAHTKGGIDSILSPPSNRPPHVWSRITNFSIENILRKDFGKPIRARQKDYIRHLSNFTVESLFSSTYSHQKKVTAIKESHRGVNKTKTIDGSLEVEQSTRYNESQQEVECPLETKNDSTSNSNLPWPAWVYCTRYSDRPSSGPRLRKIRARPKRDQEKRPRTAFSAAQLQRLKQEFQINNYLTEERRRSLAMELELSESQIKIWFQNKRAKMKKAAGFKNTLAICLMSQGLYDHSTVPISENEADDQEESNMM